MLKCNLPFVLEVPLRSDLDYALPLSVVAADSGYMICVHGAFIQMFFPRDKQDYDRVLLMPGLKFEDWENLQFIETVRVDAQCRFLSDPRNLLDFIVKNLDEERYIEVQIDEYFIPGRPCYGKNHQVRDNLLIGYDAERVTFMIAGYGNDYETTKVSFTDFLLAFYHMPKSQLRKSSLRTVRRCRETIPRFYPANVRLLLIQYLQSAASVPYREKQKNPPYRQARCFKGSWGLDSYSAFQEYFRTMSAERRALDLRASTTLWEHKACMLNRLRYMESEGFIDRRNLFEESYREVEELAHTLRFTAYEYNVDGFLPSYTRELMEGLTVMRDKEARILEAVVAQMKVD